MANQTYLRILQAIESFASEHLQIKKFASDFPEQLPNFATKDEAYPILWVSPSSGIYNQYTNSFDLTVYCYDIIQKDRENINTILSDTHQILNDLTKWLKDGDIAGIDLVNTPTVIPINNDLLDYTAGWQMTISLVVDTYSICEIPFNEQPAILDVVNNIVYSKYLTCETLSECETIVDIENNLSGLTANLIKKQNLPTGFITGMQLSINSDNTKFDIAAGGYVITDFSDIQNINVQIIEFNGLSGITPQYLNTNNITYIGIDVNQTIIQKDVPFTNEERRSIAILGAVIHSNKIFINVTNEIKAPIVAPTNQLHDFIKAVGVLNLDGNIYGPNGANLMLNKSMGTVFGLGINAQDYLNPHQLDIPSQTGLTFRYRLQNGFEYADRTTIDPTNYDLNGVLTALQNNNKWSVQHINLFQSGLARIQYGQEEYNSLEEAEADLKTGNFVVESNIGQNAIFRSYLIVKKNATNLSDPTQAKFIPVDKFGNVVSGAVSLTFNSIITALGYTPEDSANKTDVIGTGTTTNYPSTKAVVDYITTANGTWKKSGLSTNANLVNEKIYRQNSVNVIGSVVNFGTGPTQADVDNEILGSQFGHIFGGGTVPFIQLLGNGGNGSAGPNQFISRMVGAPTTMQQMTFSAIKSTNYDSWGDAGRLLWRFQDGYLAPQAKFDIGTDYVRFASYTSSRNDTSDTMNNVLFTTSNGSLRSKPVANAPFISKSTGTTYTTNAIKTVTQAEYDAIVTKDPNTLYFII